MNVHDATRAHKYATAFVAVFGVHNDWIEQFDTLVGTFENNGALLVLFTLPNVSVDKKIDLFRTFFSHISSIYAIERLMRVLIIDKQILLMVKILEKIVALYHKQQGIMRCYIESSHMLQEDDKQTIRYFITQHSKYTAHCIFRLNPKLIAGIRIQAPMLFWQYSIRAQLQALRTKLVH